jgi:hypothetical protein
VITLDKTTKSKLGREQLRLRDPDPKVMLALFQ